MAPPPPRIDRRSVDDIVAQSESLLQTYASWRPRRDDDPGRAWVRIFAHLAKLVIDRLNKAPEKNLLSFLDLLGASLLPPQPARVPLTFTLPAGSADDATVPAGTQAAALPSVGETEPVIFETERALVVTVAELTSIFARDPRQDTYADHSAIVAADSLSGVAVFRARTPIEHILYLGHDTLLAYSGLEEVRLSFQLQKDIENADPRMLRWEIWDGARGQSIAPDLDDTAHLTKSGDIVFRELSRVPEQAIAYLDENKKQCTRTSRWLRCHLLTPITTATTAQEGMVRDDQIPEIERADIYLANKGRPLDMVFANAAPVDPGKGFYPFAEKPKLGDVFYLASREAFSVPGTAVTLHVDPMKQGTADEKLQLSWEYWNGNSWQQVTCTDSSGNLTGPGTIKFSVPQDVMARSVNGMAGWWIRACISQGSYGHDIRYVANKENGKVIGYSIEPANFDPPMAKSVSVDYEITRSCQTTDFVAYNNFTYKLVRPPFKAYEKLNEDAAPSAYFGLSLPAHRPTFPRGALSLYFRTADPVFSDGSGVPSEWPPSPLTWEYWGGERWKPLVVDDGTAAFTRPGVVGFLGPEDFQKRSEFGFDRYWLRVRRQDVRKKIEPKLRRVLLNTAMARQTITVADEVLGSSDASEGQAFRTTRKPVLEDPRLDVREPSEPSLAEQAKIKEDLGEGAIAIVRDAAGKPAEIRVRWRQVTDFYASGPRDRHYVMDHVAGVVLFGDGVNGMIPPRGTDNVRMTRYRTGGGVVGNRPAGTITQIRSFVSNIETVTNSEAAAGGAEAEDANSLLERAPRTLRHRDRAVTVEDYEDLAMLASPEVARVKCVPLRNLVAEPLAETDRKTPGEVSVIVVPRTEDAKPLPSLELIGRVKDHLTERCIPSASVSVLPPLYVQVNVTARVAAASLPEATRVEQEVREALDKFLHPLTGGIDRSGWAFGREPHSSDLYELMARVSGVDHVRTLIVEETVSEGDAEALSKVKKTGVFLVCSGAHAIRAEA